MSLVDEVLDRYLGECNYRCRVAREAFALAGTEPYVSAETRRDTEAYE